jgi:hypothetical protein
MMPRDLEKRFHLVWPAPAKALRLLDFSAASTRISPLNKRRVGGIESVTSRSDQTFL